MSLQEVERCLPEARRRKAFRLLVTGQDLEMTVAESRADGHGHFRADRSRSHRG